MRYSELPLAYRKFAYKRAVEQGVADRLVGMDSVDFFNWSKTKESSFWYRVYRARRTRHLPKLPRHAILRRSYEI